MEEKKAKTVDMNIDNNNVKDNHVNNNMEKKKLTYEQLNNVCNQLWQQNRQLMMKNKELEQIAINKRLDYLFKVLELSNKFNEEFIIDCTNEIRDAITIPAQLEEESKVSEHLQKESHNGMKLEGEDLERKGL